MRHIRAGESGADIFAGNRLRAARFRGIMSASGRRGGGPRLEDTEGVHMRQSYRLVRPDDSSCDIREAARVMVDWIGREPSARYELTVGTDSQNFDDTKMVEVVVLRRVGSGGIFFYHIDRIRRIDQLRTKIYEETQRSLELAGELIPAFREALDASGMDLGSVDVHVAIHCDIGKSGATRAMLKEIAGWVEAQGYDCMIKPDSYAASGVANRLSK